MNSTGRHSEKSGYLVILLLVVGLTAFSHSMKELTEIHHLTLDASRSIAQWSGNITPAEIPQTPITLEKIDKIAKIETCESKQSAAPVELPWLDDTREQPTPPSAVRPGRKQIRIERPNRSVNIGPSEADIAELKKLPRVKIDADEFEVRIPTVQLPEAGDTVSPEIPEFTFKAKARKHGTLRMNPRDREMLLKTLNRSINLRIAS